MHPRIRGSDWGFGRSAVNRSEVGALAGARGSARNLHVRFAFVNPKETQ